MVVITLNLFHHTGIHHHLLSCSFAFVFARHHVISSLLFLSSFSSFYVHHASSSCLKLSRHFKSCKFNVPKCCYLILITSGLLVLLIWIRDTLIFQNKFFLIIMITRLHDYIQVILKLITHFLLRCNISS